MTPGKKKEKPRKYEMRINLKDVDTTDPDELLAQQLQLEEEENLVGKGESRKSKEKKKSKAIEGVDRIPVRLGCIEETTAAAVAQQHSSDG